MTALWIVGGIVLGVSGYFAVGIGAVWLASRLGQSWLIDSGAFLQLFWPLVPALLLIVGVAATGAHVGKWAEKRGRAARLTAAESGRRRLASRREGKRRQPAVEPAAAGPYRRSAPTCEHCGQPKPERAA